MGGSLAAVFGECNTPINIRISKIMKASRKKRDAFNVNK